MQRVDDPADPRRCQGHDRGGRDGGQCMNLAVEGGQYCMAHGGYHAMIRQENSDQRLYHLTEARSQGRLADLIKHDPTSFLYEVTAAAVMLLENMERATLLDMDFVSSYADKSALMLVIERLKRATLRIQQNVTVLVNKASLYDFGRVLIDLTHEEVKDYDDANIIVERVATQITQLVRAAANEEHLPSLEASEPLQRLKTFQLKNTRDSQRLDELRQHGGLMSLYEEIVIQLMQVERRWNMVENDTELLAACSQLTQGLKSLERLIKSAHEQAQAIGELLTPPATRQVVMGIIEIVSRELKPLPNFEAAIDRVRDLTMLHFSRPALPAPDEELGSPSLEHHG